MWFLFPLCLLEKMRRHLLAQKVAPLKSGTIISFPLSQSPETPRACEMFISYQPPADVGVLGCAPVHWNASEYVAELSACLIRYKRAGFTSLSNLLLSAFLRLLLQWGEARPTKWAELESREGFRESTEIQSNGKERSSQLTCAQSNGGKSAVSVFDIALMMHQCASASVRAALELRSGATLASIRLLERELAQTASARASRAKRWPSGPRWRALMSQHESMERKNAFSTSTEWKDPRRPICCKCLTAQEETALAGGQETKYALELSEWETTLPE